MSNRALSITCCGCGREVDPDDWRQHRQTCLGLADQLALSPELDPAVFHLELQEDHRRGHCRAREFDPATGRATYIARRES